MKGKKAGLTGRCYKVFEHVHATPALLEVTAAAARSKLQSGFSRVKLSDPMLLLRMGMLPALSMQMTLRCCAQVDRCGTTMTAHAPRNKTISKTSVLSVEISPLCRINYCKQVNQWFVHEDVTLIYAYMPHLPAHRVTFFATP